jgi:hypothetical protein
MQEQSTLPTISQIDSPRSVSFSTSQFAAFSLHEYSDVYLSLASYMPIAAKDPSFEVSLDRGRLTVFEHFEKLLSEASPDGASIPSGTPVLAISCRNVLANLRCGAWVRGRTPSLLTVQSEDSSKSRRPYHFLAFRDGRFSIDEAFAESAYLDTCSWAFTGVPVYWDGEDIRDRMLAEVADLSHLFKLSRGADPSVTKESVARWRFLQKFVTQCLYIPRAEAVRRLREVTDDLPPQDTYLHNCAGVTVDGKLIVIIANGRLEDIGGKLADLGARRAIVLDNGGSSSVFYFRNSQVDSGLQLVAGPNFRPAGTAYLFAVLKDGQYRSLRSFGS